MLNIGFSWLQVGVPGEEGDCSDDCGSSGGDDVNGAAARCAGQSGLEAATFSTNYLPLRLVVKRAKQVPVRRKGGRQGAPKGHDALPGEAQPVNADSVGQGGRLGQCHTGAAIDGSSSRLSPPDQVYAVSRAGASRPGEAGCESLGRGS